MLGKKEIANIYEQLNGKVDPEALAIFEENVIKKFSPQFHTLSDNLSLINDVKLAAAQQTAEEHARQLEGIFVHLDAQVDTIVFQT